MNKLNTMMNFKNFNKVSQKYKKNKRFLVRNQYSTRK